MDTLPRPPSVDPSAPTVAGRLRLRLENDGKWWTLFDPEASRDQIEQTLTSLGIFRSPQLHRIFLENNTITRIVRELWWSRKDQPLVLSPQVKLGFARLVDVLLGRDPIRRSLTFMLALTPLCATSPSSLKTVLGEATDMGVLCGHNEETRLAWVWFKSLLCTLVAFFSSTVKPPSSTLPVDRDSCEVNEILRQASLPNGGRCKWKVCEEQKEVDEDWLKASFEGRYRSNSTRCWWRKDDDDGLQETSLDEMIAARITGHCPADGVVGIWLGGNPDLVLSARELTSFRISTDPWERLDRQDIPLTKATTDSFETPAWFDPSTFPRSGVHATTGIPFEILRGFPCVPKERQLIQ